MTVNNHVHSPLESAKHGHPDSVRLREIPFIPSFDLRVAPETHAFTAVNETLGIMLPTKVGQTQGRAGFHALCLGPDWWLILGNIQAIPLLEPIRAQFHLAIVDVSAQRTHIELEGPSAREVLEHVWDQDLRESRFGVGCCTQGLMAKAPSILWHCLEQRYHISVRSSFASHLWTVLLDASVEYLENQK